MRRVFERAASLMIPIRRPSARAGHSGTLRSASCLASLRAESGSAIPGSAATRTHRHDLPGFGPRDLGAILALATVLLGSCAPRTPRFDAARLTNELRSPLEHWVVYWRGYDPAFALDSLRWTVADSVHFEQPRAISDSLRNTADSKWWAWSPDRTRAVNPDTYREWDPDRKEFLYDADAASELLDFTTRTASLLEFCGTSCRNDDAVWLDRERFAVMGWQDIDNGDSLFEPVVTVYDLDRRTTAIGLGRAVRTHP
jgi:hypothetical protein